MVKRGKSHKKGYKNPKKDSNVDKFDPQDMDDEIDKFHKQRDFIPLDMNGNSEESDDDDEQPVLELKGINVDEDDDDDDYDDEDDKNNSLAAKIVRQRKFLRSKFGGVEDEMQEEEDNEEPKSAIWISKYGGDNRDFELQSSDDESLAEEEEEVARLQTERAQMLSPEDFGLENVSEDESDRDLTLEEISAKGKNRATAETLDGLGTAYEAIKKDINTLSKEEQMDVVISSAPELVGLLSELDDALEQLNSKVNPLLSKVKDGELRLRGGEHYLEVKQQLLLDYCQSITFYLLLKSEGQTVRDHPVIARLVEIKELLNKMKQLDENCALDFEEYLKDNHKDKKGIPKPVKETSLLATTSDTRSHNPSPLSSDMQKSSKQPQDGKELLKVESADNDEKKGEKRKHQSDMVGLQSMKMLKTRAALEEKLRQTGVFSSVSKKGDKGQKHLKPVNGQLETFDDFNDDDMDVGQAQLTKLSQLISAKTNKPKFVSGDDDLPKRDDIGERRRKHELRVLARAGIVSTDDVNDDVSMDGSDEDADMEGSESEDDFYEQVKKQRAAKHAAKAEIYTRTSAAPSLPEIVDGKRHITTQIEKNKGLTRPRNKKTKNPRKKYRVKHDKQQKRRKGQVRDVIKPQGPYGGERTGINTKISRSVRF